MRGLLWQDLAVMHPPPALADGKMLAECIPQRPTVARCCRSVFSGCRPWQYFALVHPRALANDRNVLPGVRQWQDLAAMRFRAAIRGSFFASCVPEGASDGKSASSRQHTAAVHPKRAGFGKICAPCIRKALQTGVRGCTARRSCQEGAPFAARAPQIMHGAQILPFLGAPFERFNLSQAGAVLAVRALPPPACVPLPRIARSCAVSGWVAAPPLHAPLRPNRVVGSACRAAHAQLLLACISVVASATRPKQRDRVVCRRKHGAVMVFR